MKQPCLFSPEIEGQGANSPEISRVRPPTPRFRGTFDLQLSAARKVDTPSKLSPGIGGRGANWIVILLLVLMTTCVWAQPTPSAAAAQTRVVLVLCDGLTFDDLHNNTYPHLYHLAESGAVGLMNTAVTGPKTPTAAVLTLALGTQQPSEPGDELAFDVREKVPDETGSASDIFRRQIGSDIPHGKQIVHLGIDSLIRRELNTSLLGAILAAAQPSRRVVICGNADTDRPQRRAALLAIDAQGLASGDVALTQADPEKPYGLTDANVERMSHYIVDSDASLFVLQIGDLARLTTGRRFMSPHLNAIQRRLALTRLDLLLYLLETRFDEAGQRADVLLVAPYPQTELQFHVPGWGRLSPLLAFGPDFLPGLLMSPTTRTAGLIANVDVAPTILRLLDCDVPTAMTGRPFHSMATGDIDGDHRIALLARQDFLAVLNAQAMTEVTVPLAAACLAIFLLAFLLRWRRGPRAARPWAWIMICGANFPIALLFAPILVPPTLLEYGLRIAAWMGTLTVLCYLLARPLRLSPPVIACLTGLIVLAADLLTGQHLLKDSLLSSNALTGVRYYGIGNEYLGVALSMSLLGVFAWLDDRSVPLPAVPTTAGPESQLPNPKSKIQNPKSKILLVPILIWLALMWLLGWPGLGANSGSLVVTTVAFGAGIALLTGRRPTWRLWLACVVGGLLLSFAFSAIDAVTAREGSSHAGRALRAATHGRGGGYLLTIAWRKIKMNLGFLLNPFLWLDGAITIAVVLAARALIGNAVRETLRRRPWLARGLATLPGTIAATLLFKDSGFVTVAFLIGGACIVVLWYALTDDALTDPA
jgi:hypothetical protein